MTNSSTDATLQYQPKDRWGTRRIWVSGAFGATFSGSRLILDFWPLGAGGSLGNNLRGLLDFSLLPYLLFLSWVVLGLLIAAGIALWHRHLRQVASSIVAIAAIPVCFIVVDKMPIFDPWLWYTIANSTRFEALAASGPSPNGPQYAIVEIRDVSVGLVINPAHFIALVFDETDAVGLEPSERPSIWQARNLWTAAPSMPIPKGRRLYGHFFKVDDFE